jgi:spore germination protein GerM
MPKPSSNNKTFIVLGFLAVVLVGLVIIFFTGGEKEKIRHQTEVNPAKPLAPAAGESAERKTVTLFFLSDDDDLLHREEREIPAGPSVGGEALRALQELVKGSTHDLVPPLPAETKIRQVFVSKEGVAYVDFSRDIVEKFSYGSTSELAAVFAVVDTLAFNFKAVKKVAFLVEGTEKETLGGHIDLSRPFLPDFSLVAK